ncbi:MAG: 4-(cytidine 5'-diphospho)-2-C-methyl-D-erythritol kinase [Alphaproteobacteria bacterium]
MTAPRSSRDAVFAPGKLNLFLHVLGRRPNGLHRLHSLFAFLNIGDRLTFMPATDVDLTMTPDGGLSRDDNLAWRALSAVRAVDPQLSPVSVHIDKTLPAEAGLGGGTADAAAVVHWAEGQNPAASPAFRAACAGLGADMPPAMDQRARLWGGTGDEAGELVVGLGGTPVLLLKPSTGVSTGACFAALNGQFSASEAAFDLAARGGLVPALQSCGNDLQAAACSLNPDIARALTALEKAEGAWLVRMTGSGSTCFALFHEKGPRDAALSQVQQQFPTWWSAAAEIL